MEDCLRKYQRGNPGILFHHTLTAGPGHLLSLLVEAFLKGRSGSGASAHGPLGALEGVKIGTALLNPSVTAWPSSGSLIQEERLLSTEAGKEM